MLTSAVIKALRHRWQGPALTIELPNQTFSIGQGVVHTTVSFKKASVLRKLLHSPSLAFGEGYMDGDIEIVGELSDIVAGFYATTTAANRKVLTRASHVIRSLPRPDSVRQAKRNAQHHYDIGNDFYALWLDPSLTYSCAYFRSDADSLAQAQQQKIDLILQKLHLQPGQTLLDIGCGWGSLLLRAVEKYGVKATGVTPAKEQAAFLQEQIKKKGLEQQVTVIHNDWRRITGQFDRIVSVGMFEHVGQPQYNIFFRQWQRMLKPESFSLLHTIGRTQPAASNPWLQKYIFPGGYLPTLTQLSQHAAAANLTILHIENLRSHYAKTLEHWSRNFQAARSQVVTMYDEKFARMWWLYLQGARAAFIWGDLQLWQIVLTNHAQPARNLRWHIP